MHDEVRYQLRQLIHSLADSFIKSHQKFFSASAVNKLFSERTMNKKREANVASRHLSSEDNEHILTWLVKIASACARL